MLRSACLLVLMLLHTAAHAADCGALTHLTLEHGAITEAAAVSAGAVVIPGAAALTAPVDFCRIRGTSTPTPDSDIRFEVWIPSGSGWNGRFEQVGNGGFAGSLPYSSMRYALSLGYAVAGTDDGHTGDAIDASWALHHPEKVNDFGWRALDVTAIAGQRVIREFTGKAPTKSYFFGCSDGGREALMMAQRYPTYFDGIIAGAPANAMTRLLTNAALIDHDLTVTKAARHLTPAALETLQHFALQSCGHGGPVLQNPTTCHENLASLQCTAGATEHCLTSAEIATARAIFAERRDPLSGTPLYAVQPGAEAVKGSWDVWLTGTGDNSPPAGFAFGWNYLAYLVMHDPKLDLATVTAADLTRGEREFGPIIDATDPDLSAFKRHGGKLIQYHGWNDPAIAPGYSLAYHAQVKEKTAGSGDFYRLYMVPGMLHCGGGDAPTVVDWQAAIVAWVERGVAPGPLTAVDGKGATAQLQPVD